MSPAPHDCKSATTLTTLLRVIGGVAAVFILAVFTGTATQFPLCAVGAAATFVVAALKPEAALLIFFAILPVFGNRPGQSQTTALMALGAALQLGLLFSPEIRRLSRTTQYSKQNLATVGYTIVSCLSLYSIPWQTLFNEIRASIPTLTDFSAAWHVSLTLLTSTENKIFYSLLSVVWTLWAFTIGHAVFVTAQVKPSVRVSYLTAILSGLVISLLCGILDYYRLIDLHWLRALDPVVNPGDVQFRLQSFFGHSGWFAEYLTLTIPSVMALLCLPWRFRTRLGLIITLLLLGEFVLILTFQRGGWLSYPLTLLAVWACIYSAQKIEKGEQNFLIALRSSLLKVLISIPLTVLASLALIALFTKFHLLNEGATHPSVTRYLERFEEIKKTSDRTDFMRAGYKLGSLAPVLGNGSESFAYQFEREFNQPDGNFAGQISLPLHGSAHNVYMQTFSGKGLGGLILLLLMIGGTAVFNVRYALQQKSASTNDRIVLLSSAAFCAAFCIYGFVQEIFYVQPLQYLTFAFIGLSAAIRTKDDCREGLQWKSLALFISSLFILHLFWFHFYPGERATKNSQKVEYGCYNAEIVNDQTSFRWCGVRALIAIPSGTETIEIQTPTTTTKNGSQTIQILSDDGILLAEKPVSQGMHWSFHIPENLAESRGLIWLKIRTAAYFIPERDLPPSQDNRVLAFQLWTNHK